MHSGTWARSAAGEGELRVCPACGTEYPPAGPQEGPVTFCPNEGYAIVRKADVAAAHGDIMLGRTVAQRYTIVARLGTGSMGAVYRAWQDRMARWVALKIMRYDRTVDAESRARFEREARSMSQLQSPHTVTVYDFGEAEDGSVYLAMELLEGESLGQRLAREKRLPIRDAVHFVRGALTSLAEAHTKGIIHRDLKPDNLFLTEVPDVGGAPSREVCKILDFGIAKLIRDERAIDALETQAGTVFGTPRYMSPEQAQGLRLDARSDIYSLGVILYQMVTGIPPFDDEEAVVVMARHIKTKPVPPRDIAPEAEIPPSLERIILRALAKDPIDRPATAEAFLLALDAAERGFPASLPTVAPALRQRLASSASHPLPTLAPSVLRRRRRWLTAILLFISAVLIVGVIVLWRDRMASKPDAASTFAGEEDIVFEEPTEPSPVVAQSANEPPLSLDSLPIAEEHEKSKIDTSKRTSSKPKNSTEIPANSREPTAATPPTEETSPPPPPAPTPTSSKRYGLFD
ncbi:MAG: Serine/threonine-protein kinase StkP [Deltaproteobacteria bacterium ADurb.Bin207]|nr:MAG: Serine/threonine-protein kinase StkP [Deltaproteobacteria bacterium ADurb.Bin207]